MSKKNKNKSGLGRALINDRFGKSNPKVRRPKDPTMLHSSEIPDGYDWGRLNLQSVTEESSFQEFLSTAELAGTEFQAEKLNITFVNPLSGVGLLTKQEKEKVDETQNENRQFLSIPRRPKWDETTTPEQLAALESEGFLEWRRRLAMLQEEKGLVLTPYEKNLEFWRQLWRVVERSDVVVQIVDARNPLLFRCEDLEKYVCEVSPHKQNLILLNKADYLTVKQRQAWADFFGEIGVRVAFYSATYALEEEKTENLAEDENKDGEDDDDDDEEEEEEEEKAGLTEKKGENNVLENAVSDLKIESNCKDERSSNTTPEKNELEQKSNEMVSDCKDNVNFDNIGSSCHLSLETQNAQKESSKRVNNSYKLLKRSELISFFHTIPVGEKVTPGVTTVGLVGYPNVGKSSTINSLLLEKKVSVSATPGKTKHFQTLFLDKDLLLCDCPGLVMPSFMYSKAEMIVNGILPIDQMRDHVPPVNLVTSLIPRHVLEDTYGIIISPPREGEDPDRPPTSEELLNAYGYNRGFMTANGQPDNPRASRYILKDFVTGKLLYCWAPPGYPEDDFNVFPERRKKQASDVPSAITPKNHTTKDLDSAFFNKSSPTVHTKGYKGSAVGKAQTGSGYKPWKDHSAKRNKHVKLRKVYAHLDK
ncbi:hypothetical protein R5R35_012312 [Gryllus longicercus]|uniref:Large subunit GTPase 1 homolog n=1 Tax=Gryllus longicercus TaxID=2509291 RepID=A0AAN9V790_9ORTH